MTIACPFCQTAFQSPDDWCPHFIGLQGDLTLDDYKDFISGEYPAETVGDDDGNAWYFMNRDEGAEPMEGNPD